MRGGVLLDRTTGRPIVDRALRERLEIRERPDLVDLIEKSRLMPAVQMAERTPPLYMDVSNAYSGDELGLPWRDVIGEGIVGATDLAVTPQAAANSVNVAAGSAWVLGDTNPALQPNYRVYNDAVVNLGISPDASLARRVHIIAQVTDQGFAGSGRTWQLQALHGTPNASPTLPALPASAVSLANILVPAAAASSAAYTITDTRTRSTVGGGQSLLASGAAGALTYFDLHHNAALSIPNATWTNIPWNNELADAAGIHTANAVNLTLPAGGMWLIGCHFGFTTNATGLRYVQLWVGGSLSYMTAIAQPVSGGDDTAYGGVTLIPGGNLVEPRLHQTSGGALNLDIQNYWTPRFWGVKIA